MKSERRGSMRLHPGKALQVTFTCAGTSIVGHIYDISTRGVSIEYGGGCRLDAGKTITVTIAAGTQTASAVENVTCRSVYDISVLSHNQSFSGQELRLCGLAYTGLSQKNHAMLSQLMESAGH